MIVLFIRYRDIIFKHILAISATKPVPAPISNISILGRTDWSYSVIVVLAVISGAFKVFFIS